MPVPVPLSGVTRFMSSGWPQDQQDLRWPRVPGEDDAWPPGGDVHGEEPGQYGEEPVPYGAVRGSGDQWGADPGAEVPGAGDPGAADPWSAGNPWSAGRGSGDAWDGAQAAGGHWGGPGDAGGHQD